MQCSAASSSRAAAAAGRAPRCGCSRQAVGSSFRRVTTRPLRRSAAEVGTVRAAAAAAEHVRYVSTACCYCPLRRYMLLRYLVATAKMSCGCTTHALAVHFPSCCTQVNEVAVVPGKPRVEVLLQVSARQPMPRCTLEWSVPFVKPSLAHTCCTS